MTRQMITITSTLVASLLAVLSPTVVQAQTSSTPAAHKSKKVKKLSSKASKSAKKAAAKQRVSVNFATPPPAPATAAQQKQALAKAAPGRAAVVPMSQQSMSQQSPMSQQQPYIPPVNEKWVANPPQPHPLPKTAPKRPAIVVQPKASPAVVQNRYAQNSAATAQPYDTAPDLDAQEGMLRASTHYRAASPHRDFTIVPFLAGGYSTLDISGSNTSANSNQTNSGNFDYAGGILAEFEWGHIGLQTGLVYMTESSKIQQNTISADNTRDSFSGTQTLHMIGVPLLAKLTSGHHGEIRFSGKAGVIPVMETAGDVNVSTSRTYSDGTNLTGSSSESSGDTLRSINALMQAGAGIEIPLTAEVDLRIEGVYNRSLMPIENDSVGTKTFSQSFQGIVGIGVGI